MKTFNLKKLIKIRGIQNNNSDVKFPMRLKFTAIIISIVTVILLLVSMLIYFKAVSIFDSENETLMVNVIAEQAHAVEDKLSIETNMVDAVSKATPLRELVEARNADRTASFYSKNLSLLNSNIQELNRTLKYTLNHESFWIIDTYGKVITQDSINSTKDYINKDISNELFFKKTKEGKIFIGDVQTSDATGNHIFTVSAPVYNKEGTVIGLVCSRINTNFFHEYLKDVKFGETGFIYLMSQNGYLVSFNDESKIGTLTQSNGAMNIIKKLASKEDLTRPDLISKTVYNNEHLTQSFEVISNSNWVISLVRNDSEIKSNANKLLRIIMLVFMLSIIVGIIVATLVSKSIVNPIEKLSKVLESTAHGDLTIKSQISNKDELGILSNSYNLMVDNNKKLVMNIKDTTKLLLHAFNLIVDSSKNVINASEETASTMQQVSEGALNQANETETVVVKVEQIKTELVNINEASSKMKVLSEDIITNSKQSKDVITELLTKTRNSEESSIELSSIISELATNSEDIDNMNKVIIDIAEQTNLLALNASIEAARAGEQGKGFSVVADEIRKLSSEVAESSSKIKGLTKVIGERIAKAVSLMSISNKTILEQKEAVNLTDNSVTIVVEKINNIDTIINKVANAIKVIVEQQDAIFASVQDISAIAEETAASTEQVSANTEEQLASMQQLTASIDELKEVADNLDNLIKVFKV